MKKLAIIGASYLQEPLILKAKEKGIETHVFAWAVGDVGEKCADYFYPISIVEKEAILEKCKEIGVDGICSIASDLAVITVGYVADKLKLVGNSISCVDVSTNKHKMRKCFEKNGDPSPRSLQVKSISDLIGVKLNYPIIVKPVDRSGSRGINELESEEGLEEAISFAVDQSFAKYALVEEFAKGKEYSVEYISWKGKHKFLAITKKYTTGTPHFIETGHMEPAPMSPEMNCKIQAVVSHALDSLGIEYGASHSEIKIDDDGNINIIEIGGRMGGDCIGSSLVEMSTGYDFLDAVIDIALGFEPTAFKSKEEYAGIHFVFDQSDIDCLKKLKNEHPELLVKEDVHPITKGEVTDSGHRFGYFLMKADKPELLEQYMPWDETKK